MVVYKQAFANLHVDFIYEVLIKSSSSDDAGYYSTFASSDFDEAKERFCHVVSACADRSARIVCWCTETNEYYICSMTGKRINKVEFVPY